MHASRFVAGFPVTPMLLRAICLLAVLGLGSLGRGQPARTADDDLADLRMMAKPLSIRPPSSGVQKTEQENKEDQQRQAAAFAVASAKAKDFYTKNPSHAGAAEAKKIESTTLLQAVQAGLVTEEPRAQRLAAEYRSDKKQPSADRHEVATMMTQMEIGKKNIRDRTALMDEHERQALGLLGEFPNEPAVFEYFLGIARNADPVKARAMAQRVLLMPAPAALKEQARAVVDRLDLPGTAPALEWQDENGISRRAADHKGKIVVFYIWATWTPESDSAHRTIAAAIRPNMDLISVNADTDVKNGQDAKKKAGLPGGSYYDTRSLQSPLLLQLKADKVPSVHVIDAKGVYVGRGAPSELAKLLQLAAN